MTLLIAFIFGLASAVASDGGSHIWVLRLESPASCETASAANPPAQRGQIRVGLVERVSVFAVRNPLAPMIFSSPAVSLAPPLLGGVPHVVELRSEEKMAWVDTTRVVTLVKNPLSFRDRTVSDLPGNAVGRGPSNGFFGFAADHANAVSVRQSTRSPQPAFVGTGDRDVFEKSNLEGRCLVHDSSSVKVTNHSPFYTDAFEHKSS